MTPWWAAAGMVVVLLITTACRQDPPRPPDPKSCEAVIADCHARRLPDIILRNGQTDGALQPVGGKGLEAILSFDQALKRGWEEEGWKDAKKVQVVLGSADVDRLRWGQGERLFYAIHWGGICWRGLGGPYGYEPEDAPRCEATWWSVVIDARTGAFIVANPGGPPLSGRSS
jgi:hypothetical protein